MVNCSRMDCQGHVICPNIRIGGKSIFPSDCAMAPTSNSRKTNAMLTSALVEEYADVEHCVLTEVK